MGLKSQQFTICFLCPNQYRTHYEQSMHDDTKIWQNNPMTIGMFTGGMENLQYSTRFVIPNQIFVAKLSPVLVDQGRSANHVILSDGTFDMRIQASIYIDLLKSGRCCDNLGSLKGNWTFKKRGYSRLLEFLG